MKRNRLIIRTTLATLTLCGPLSAAAQTPKRSPVRRQWALTLIAVLLLCGVEEAVSAKDLPDGAAGLHRSRRNRNGKSRSLFIDPEDGRLDVSKFLDQAYGFVPIAMPITEPAVGYGVAGGLVFIDRPEQQGEAGFRRPSITVVGGLATENGTWGAMVGDMRYWLDDRLQTLAGFVYAPVNLDFYGIGDGFCARTRFLFRSRRRADC